MTSSVKSRPKFRIVEGGSLSKNKVKDIYEDFKADYLSPNITVKEMLVKYNISVNKYDQIRKIVAEETGVNRKISKTKFIRSWTHHSRFIDYVKKSDKYRVTKVIMGTKTHFGLYDDVETAVYVRDKLEANNWSQDTYKEIRKELFGEIETEDKYTQIYDDFKKDYVNGESARYLKRKYDITDYHYNQLAKKVRSETGLLRKPWIPYSVRWKHEQDLIQQQRM